jgi:Common central domain of tyrosinase
MDLILMAELLPWAIRSTVASEPAPRIVQHPADDAAGAANQRRSSYDSFWPELESVIHDRPHVWVGGVMVSRASPGDPAFFLHHCWIDLLWARWQRDHPGVPFVASCPNCGLSDPMAAYPDRKPARVLNHYALGYRYDTEPGSAWNSYQLADPGTAAPIGRVAAVSRIPNSMELWWITRDGAIQGAHWYQT